MKTYSVTIKNRLGNWITNWDQWEILEDIKWDTVKEFVDSRGDLAYGYYYGHNSRNLTSDRCRTVLWERDGK